MKTTILLAAVVFLGACSGQQATPGQPAPDNAPAQPPWGSNAVGAAAVPSVYRTEWLKAENRATCALIAITDNGVTRGATPRAATFGGGWGVAYDLAGQRSAFGVAGSGVNASEPSYDEWPFKRTWSDGSRVGYGPEGGTGPGLNQLAYLRIAGQGCLYNIWSRLGREHLESMMNAIRFVETASTPQP